MEWYTRIEIPEGKPKLSYDSKVLLLGSCFVEHIHRYLSYYQFRNLSNPFGVLYHPLALEAVLQRSVELRRYSSEDIFEREDVWRCFETHSVLSELTPEGLLANLNLALDETHAYLKSCSHVLITLGSAWAYRHLETDQYVGNCHKVPQKEFDKELISVPEIVTSLHRIVQFIKELAPLATVVFTVSPVRHLRDGFTENQRSKAHLIAALHQMLAESGGPAFYFPAYEIVMDELRDYRFYARDMVHPSEEAVAYVWERFLQTWIHKNTSATMKRVEKVQKGLAHKPFHQQGVAHQQFLSGLKEEANRLCHEYPWMRFGI